jgi:phosphatidate cytidylyltransferase
VADQRATSVADTDGGPADGVDTPAEEPPKKVSRAGRNLPAAIAVGVSLAAMLIAILLFAPYVWLGVVAVAIALATHEVFRRLRTAGYAIPIVPLLVGGQATLWLTWPFGPAGALGGFAGTVVVAMIWRLAGLAARDPNVAGLAARDPNVAGLAARDPNVAGLAARDPNVAGLAAPDPNVAGLAAPDPNVAGLAAPGTYLRDISTTVFLATWVPLFASFGALLIYPHDGAGRVFCLMLGVTFSDIGGYTAGVLFGKHPMVPAISPKKSWEGLAGSLLFGITASVLAVAFLLHRPAWVGVPLGLMLVVTGTLGDLVESQVKRDLGIKDMGTLLPGHGGLMDRLDSLLPSAVATWIVLTLLA